MEIRQVVGDIPVFDKLPVIDDPDLMVELMFMSNWERITDCGLTLTVVHKGDKTYILNIEGGKT